MVTGRRGVQCLNEQIVREPLAERVGFEPTEPFGSAVFKTAPFDRSGTSPRSEMMTPDAIGRHLMTRQSRQKWRHGDDPANELGYDAQTLGVGRPNAHCMSVGTRWRHPKPGAGLRARARLRRLRGQGASSYPVEATGTLAIAGSRWLWFTSRKVAALPRTPGSPASNLSQLPGHRWAESRRRPKDGQPGDQPGRDDARSARAGLLDPDPVDREARLVRRTLCLRRGRATGPLRSHRLIMGR
jgi:hypothetical protein